MRNLHYKPAVRWVIRWWAWFIGRCLPLSARQVAAGRVTRWDWPWAVEFAMGMFDDIRRRDPVALHRFLWSNHLAYAARYEVERKFGASRINPNRHILFSQLSDHLRARGMNPHQDIQSVLEIGCSMGYLLRHLEEAIFSSASVLHGLDIDAYAIRAGSAHLSSLGSRVELFTADMETADRVIGTQLYDVVLCCGVLMYVNESMAEKILRDLFARTRHVVGLICLAPSEPGRPEVRMYDGTFVHDIESMIRSAGGRIASSNWIGTDISGSSPSHVILAEPAFLPFPPRLCDSVSPSRPSVSSHSQD